MNDTTGTTGAEETASGTRAGRKAARPHVALPIAQADAARVDETTVAFHRALTELVRVYQFRDRDRICCHDISVTQCYALEALVRGGALTLNELAAALYLDKSTASRVADGLERKGYLERRPHPESRRSVLLAATAAGAALHGRIEADLLAEEAQLLADFPADVRHSAARLLEKLAAAAASRVDTSGGTCCRVAS